MKTRVLAPALAVLALATATTAQAQQQACVQAADLGDAVLYAMPLAYDAVSTTCGKQLKSDGFLARDKGRFIQSFRAKQDAAWPGAFLLLKTFMASDKAAEGGKDDGMAAMIAALPESSLRPFVDGLVGQMIAGEIKPDSCDKIERGMELLSPLPPENIAGLLAFVAELSDIKNPEICPANPPVAAR
ncbi:MAG: hypothetical protein RSE14_02930 [Erythrobacter sp.]|jgi:hypothetical protein|uniref:hypothetical protein n=1 Tax=Erythrobacter sp. TaxID=1042 RepID=UPI002B48CF6B|nr:hypothetical protein [Erythrobacter sp.]WRH71066.1 MAG: hypothetical protein RSE14_02930 [Erythrobacter sp.]